MNELRQWHKLHYLLLSRVFKGPSLRATAASFQYQSHNIHPKAPRLPTTIPKPTTMSLQKTSPPHTSTKTNNQDTSHTLDTGHFTFFHFTNNDTSTAPPPPSPSQISFINRLRHTYRCRQPHAEKEKKFDEWLTRNPNVVVIWDSSDDDEHVDVDVDGEVEKYLSNFFRNVDVGKKGV
ncbi:hypothetical protein AC578_4355 [Pseudocercospora eumusae]|uniref:Uncharacterized protein n=1 Tax=Pseudocercospora eumusae TaxID=321146 RepID=A0A139H5N5_9PEZI|nr:hypothetical protein AC578_4355 [Pseudocercospora eumusae]